LTGKGALVIKENKGPGKERKKHKLKPESKPSTPQPRTQETKRAGLGHGKSTRKGTTLFRNDRI